MTMATRSSSAGGSGGGSGGVALAFLAGAAVATASTLAVVTLLERNRLNGGKRCADESDDAEWVLIDDREKAEAKAGAADASDDGGQEAGGNAVLSQHRPIGVHSTAFLAAVHASNDPHMGVENMGPLLHAIVRFTKPKRVFEIGAGATSLYLLQVRSWRLDRGMTWYPMPSYAKPSHTTPSHSTIPRRAAPRRAMLRRAMLRPTMACRAIRPSPPSWPIAKNSSPAPRQ